MYDLWIARIVHIIGVILWIGGLAFVTTVILPTIKKFKSKEEKIDFFEKVEHKFAVQSRITTLIVGLSGLHMVARLKAWERFLDISYWWLHLMALIWLIFTLMLFVLEPFFLKKRLMEKAKIDPDAVYRKMYKTHLHLLLLSLLAIIGGVAGAHGWLFF